MPEPTQASEKNFAFTLSESELTFVANAIFSVDIKAKDAKWVGDFQQKIIAILTTPVPVQPADPVE